MTGSTRYVYESLVTAGNQGGIAENMLRPFWDGVFFSPRYQGIVRVQSTEQSVGISAGTIDFAYYQAQSVRQHTMTEPEENSVQKEDSDEREIAENQRRSDSSD